VGELVITFWTPPGEPFPIRGTAYGNLIGGIWSTVTGDISFITNTGLAFSGTLNFYRLNYPVAGVYVMSGTVNGPTGSAQWLADTYVVP
jgi:hypothetical protein